MLNFLLGLIFSIDLQKLFKDYGYYLFLCYISFKYVTCLLIVFFAMDSVKVFFQDYLLLISFLKNSCLIFNKIMILYTCRISKFYVVKFVQLLLYDFCVLYGKQKDLTHFKLIKIKNLPCFLLLLLQWVFSVLVLQVPTTIAFDSHISTLKISHLLALSFLTRTRLPPTPHLLANWVFYFQFP